LLGKYPVFVIDRVNHAQVASGDIPEVVIEADIDAEVDGEEAYDRYYSITQPCNATITQPCNTTITQPCNATIMQPLLCF
jgi:hypothetical protein